jgi:hypothetical protein
MTQKADGRPSPADLVFLPNPEASAGDVFAASGFGGSEPAEEEGYRIIQTDPAWAKAPLPNLDGQSVDIGNFDQAQTRRKPAIAARDDEEARRSGFRIEGS